MKTGERRKERSLVAFYECQLVVGRMVLGKRNGMAWRGAR